jgi:hypothetical protein
LFGTCLLQRGTLGGFGLHRKLIVPQPKPDMSSFWSNAARRVSVTPVKCERERHRWNSLAITSVAAHETTGTLKSAGGVTDQPNAHKATAAHSA